MYAEQIIHDPEIDRAIVQASLNNYFSGLFGTKFMGTNTPSCGILVSGENVSIGVSPIVLQQQSSIASIGYYVSTAGTSGHGTSVFLTDSNSTWTTNLQPQGNIDSGTVVSTFPILIDSKSSTAVVSEGEQQLPPTVSTALDIPADADLPQLFEDMSNVIPFKKKKKNIWELAAKARKKVPKESWTKLPSDLASNVDHYLYGK